MQGDELVFRESGPGGLYVREGGKAGGTGATLIPSLTQVLAEPEWVSYEGSPELIWAPLPSPHPLLVPQRQESKSSPAGSAASFPLCWGHCTPLSPERVRAEGGSVPAGPVEKAESWVYPGQQPRKPKHVIKRSYLLRSAFWDKSSQCCPCPVTSVWALHPLPPGSDLSLEAGSAAQFQLVLSVERTDPPFSPLGLLTATPRGDVCASLSIP